MTINTRRAAFAVGASATLAAVTPHVVRWRDDRRATSSELSARPPLLNATTVTTDDGTRLHAVEIGRGTPLVLVHGLSLTHDLWRYQFADLSDRFRIVAYDLRGHGQSTIGTAGIGPHQSAADLAAVLEHFDLRDAVLLGHSIGGTVVGQFCADHPDVARERVSGLVFVDTFASAISGEGRLREICSPLLAHVGAALSARRTARRPETAMTYFAARSPFGPKPNPEHVRFTLQLATQTEPPVASAAVVANLDFDVRDQLRDLDIPALIIRGSADRLSTARSTEQLQRALARPNVEIIEGVGHLPMLEARHRFSELVADFAEQLSSRPGIGGDVQP